MSLNLTLSFSVQMKDGTTRDIDQYLYQTPTEITNKVMDIVNSSADILEYISEASVMGRSIKAYEVYENFVKSFPLYDNEDNDSEMCFREEHLKEVYAAVLNGFEWGYI